MSAFHPELARGRFIPAVPVWVPFIRKAMNPTPKPKPAPDDVRIENVLVPGPNGDVRLRIYRPKALIGETPALFWIHGGGYVLGRPEQDDARSIEIARTLGITVAATAYRLAPDHAAPAAVEDAYATLTWLFAHAADRGIDASRIAVGGASAGGGLAAGLVLYAHDKVSEGQGEVQPCFQLLVYPMLDDRTVARTDHDTKNAR